MKKWLVGFLMCISLVFILPAELSAQGEVVVAPADRERMIRMQDGRQIRLPAGAQLLRFPDGRFAVARPAPQSVEALEPEPAAKQPPKTASDSMGNRWQWFAGGEMVMRMVSRDYIFETDEVNDPREPDTLLPIKVDRKIKEVADYYADGQTHVFNFSEEYLSYGLTLGVKDTQKQNLYKVGYHMDSEMSELIFAGQWGFVGLPFTGPIVPYLRAVVAAGFRDGLFSMEANAFAYGLGLGLSLPVGSKMELYGGADWLQRKWGNEPSKGVIDLDDQSSVSLTWGVEKREDSEMRLGFGLRYFF